MGDGCERTEGVMGGCEGTKQVSWQSNNLSGRLHCGGWWGMVVSKVVHALHLSQASRRGGVRGKRGTALAITHHIEVHSGAL